MAKCNDVIIKTVPWWSLPLLRKAFSFEVLFSFSWGFRRILLPFLSSFTGRPTSDLQPNHCIYVRTVRSLWENLEDTQPSNSAFHRQPPACPPDKLRYTRHYEVPQINSEVPLDKLWSRTCVCQNAFDKLRSQRHRQEFDKQMSYGQTRVPTLTNSGPV